MSDLPNYNSKLCRLLDLPSDLGQTYSKVVTHVYPLRASAAKLQSFCNAYLNAQQSEIEFKVAAPWVLMFVGDYQKMSGNAGGYVAQREMGFGIPLTYKDNPKDSKELRKWALVCPFIYVDNPMSMLLGRQVYGWSKARIIVDKNPPDLNPVDSVHILSINEHSLTENVSPDPISQLVEQKRPFFTGRSGIETALTGVPKVVSGYFSAMSSAFDLMSNVFSGYEFKNLTSAARDIQGSAGLAYRWLSYMSDFAGSTVAPMLGQTDVPSVKNSSDVTMITFKQFRDVNNQDTSCYQAVVWSTIRVEKIWDGGLLFDPISSDLTGGIKITVSVPEKKKSGENYDDVVEQLGIEADNSSVETGVRKYCLHPVVPFWSKSDLHYDKGEKEYWRAPNTDWSWTTKRPSQSPGPHIAQPRGYNPHGSGAEQEVGGIQGSPQFYQKVYGLYAKDSVLNDLLEKYFDTSANERNRYTFKVRSAKEFGLPEDHFFILMLITSFDQMTGSLKETAGLSDQMVTFAVPVSVFLDGTQKSSPAADAKMEEARKKGLTIDETVAKDAEVKGLVPLYNFVGEDWNVFTEQEVYGRFTLKSTIRSPEIAWMRRPQSGGQPLLNVRIALPQFGDDKKAVETDLITIQSIPPPSGNRPRQPSLAALGSDVTLPQLARMYLNMLGISSFSRVVSRITRSSPSGETEPSVSGDTQSSLAHGMTRTLAYSTISQKQVRDAVEIKKAGYQAIVSVPRTITADESEDPTSGLPRFTSVPDIEVTIQGFDNFDMVKTMGLIEVPTPLLVDQLLPPKTPSSPGKPVTYTVKALPGISIAGEMKDKNPQILCSRVWDGAWDVNPNPMWDSEVKID
jgi:hypothetical protein